MLELLQVSILFFQQLVLGVEEVRVGLLLLIQVVLVILELLQFPHIILRHIQLQEEQEVVEVVLAQY
jgi:hypothetical protein